MTNKKKILFSSFQIGCANNLFPVALALQRRGHHVKIYAAGKSTQKWTSCTDITHHCINDHIELEEVHNILEREEPDILITGTDRHSHFDYFFRIAANKRNITTFTFLDYWSFYQDRFFKDKNLDRASLPQKVFTIDHVAKRELIKCGLEESRISVTGSPSYEFLKNTYHLDSKKTKPYKVLFLSQPITILHGNKLGLSEIVSLNSLVRTLENYEQEVELTIKPHPRESIENIKKNLIVKKLDNIHFMSPKEDFYQSLSRYELVTGIVSSSLIEAAILGCKTLSIQNGKNDDFHFFGTISKINPTAFNDQDILNALNNKSSDLLKAKDLRYLYEGALNNILQQLN